MDGYIVIKHNERIMVFTDSEMQELLDRAPAIWIRAMQRGNDIIKARARELTKAPQEGSPTE